MIIIYLANRNFRGHCLLFVTFRLLYVLDWITLKSKIQNIYHTSKIPFFIDNNIIFVIRLRITPTLQLYHYALLLVCSVEVKKYVIWLIFSRWDYVYLEDVDCNGVQDFNPIQLPKPLEKSWIYLNSRAPCWRHYV